MPNFHPDNQSAKSPIESPSIERLSSIKVSSNIQTRQSDIPGLHHPQPTVPTYDLGISNSSLNYFFFLPGLLPTTTARSTPSSAQSTTTHPLGLLGPAMAPSPRMGPPQDKQAGMGLGTHIYPSTCASISPELPIQ